MLNRTYLFNAVSHKILTYKIENDKLTLVSDKKWFAPIEVQHSGRFLEQFLKTEEDEATSGAETLPATVVPMPEVLQVSSSLKDVLLDNIKRVQENKEYIPQATAINENARTLIDLAKTEIAYHRIKRVNQ